LPGYIPEGVTLFVGKPKIGKSWMLLDVCLASAADRFALGSVKPAQGDVLYLALEDSRRRLKDRLEKICPQGSVPGRLWFVTEWRRAGSGGVEDIAEWCDSVSNPLLVIVDTLERFRPATRPGSLQYSNDYAAISALQTLAHDRQLAIVIVHHVRKMEADDPFDMVSGTNGLAGAADTILVLKRQAGNTTLYARGRDIDEKATACEFNKSSCRWTLLGEAERIRSSAEREAVLEAISGSGAEGMSIAEILVATGRRDRNAIDQLLFKMLRDGEIGRLKRGIYTTGKIGKKERNEDQPAE
jgi:RecA-family ATPase